jgi:Calx-beta domain-containing protein
VTFTLTATGLSLLDGSASVDYATVAGTAAAPGDFASTNGTATVSWLTGNSATVTVDVNGDTAPERDETFAVVLSNASPGSSIADGSGLGTITNDDAPHLSISDPSVSEGAGAAVFTVSLDGASAVTVHYATADGTAQSGSDYTSRSGTLSFARSESSKTISVPILDDGAHEETESFGLALTSPSGAAATGNDLAATATIADDDAEASQQAPPPPATTTTTGGSSGSPAGGATTSGSSIADLSAPSVTLSRPRAKRGTIVVTIGCPATEILCRGTLTTFSQPDRHSKVRQLRSERRLGSTTFVIRGGKTASITTRLSKRTRALLRRAGRVSVRSYAVVRDGAGNIGTASAAARLTRVR